MTKTMAPLMAALLVPTLALAQTSSSSTATAPAAKSAAPTATAPVKKDEKKAANPLANAVQARTPEEQARQSGFQLMTSLDHYLGAGTFVNAAYYSYLGASLGVMPQYLFGIGKQRLVLSATARLNYEYTLPDSETGRKFDVADTRIGLSAPAVFRDKALTGIAFSPNLGVTVPTSLQSWNARMLTMISLGVTMSRSVGTVDFRAQVGGSRGIFLQPFNGARNPNAGVEPAQQTQPTDANGNLYLLCRQGEPFCDFSNWNTAWSFSVGGQVQWRATGSLLFYVGYSFMKTWRNAATTEVDAYTAKALDENGNPVARVGLGQSDRTSTFFGASYQLNEHYSLDLGVSTIQAPLTATGQVRFPFLSFGAWADNATSLYFTLSAAY